MKILHVDETFHPAFGYQANPLAKFQQKQGNEVYIVTPTKDFLYPVYREFGDYGEHLVAQDAAYEKSTGVKIIRVPAKGYFMKRLVYGREIFDVVEEVKPDVVFVHCIETLTAMRFILKNPKYPMMFDSHMLSMASGNKLARIYELAFRRILTPKIVKREYDVIRTQDDNYVNSHLGIPKRQTPFISFGTDTMLFCPSKEVRRQFRKKNGIGQDDFVVVYTGKLTEAKGGKLLAETFKNKFDIPVTLVCVGTLPSDVYGQEVKRILDESQNRIIMFPTQNYLDLAQFYQMADLSVFPKQCSMSFYDAQACGLPVLSEMNNINMDRVSHNNGTVFEAGSVQDFRKKIYYFASMKSDEIEEYRRSARCFVELNYDYSHIAMEYTNHLVSAIQHYQKTTKEKTHAEDRKKQLPGMD